MRIGHRHQDRELPGILPTAAAVSLEIMTPEAGEPSRLQVQAKSITNEGVILEGGPLPRNFPLRDLQGQAAVLQLPPDGMVKGTRIKGKVLWVQEGDNGSPLRLGLDLEEADLKSRRLLENRLLSNPRDLQEFWSHWDDIHIPAPAPAPGTDPKVYFVGLGMFAGGLILHFTGPENLKAMGSFLAFYGSLVIAGYSLWNMWSQRSVDHRGGVPAPGVMPGAEQRGR